MIEIKKIKNKEYLKKKQRAREFYNSIDKIKLNERIMKDENIK